MIEAFAGKMYRNKFAILFAVLGGLLPAYFPGEAIKDGAFDLTDAVLFCAGTGALIGKVVEHPSNTVI